MKDYAKDKKKSMLVVKNPDIPKSSSFLVTVNTNQTTASLHKKKIDPKGFAVKLEQTATNLLEQEENYIPREDTELLNSDIYSVRVASSAFEIGPQKGTYHVHVHVTVRYKNTTSGYFHVDIKKFKKGLLDVLPIAEVYVNVRFAKSISDTISNYIEKQKATNPDFDLHEHSITLGQKRKKGRENKKTGGEDKRNGEATPKSPQRGGAGNDPEKRKRGRPRKQPKYGQEIIF